MSSPSPTDAEPRLTPSLASSFARIALGHVTREFPNKMDHVIDGHADVLGPRALHPIFFGSFDWHSCVHSHWLLATLLRLQPDIPEAGAIRDHLNQAMTPDNVAGEVAYLDRPSARGFTRPYGWGWLLKLQSELLAHQDRRWAIALQPLASAFADRFRAFLPLAHYPIRTGVHSSTAFAIALAQDYALASGEEDLTTLFRDKALTWHLGDQNAQAWEPSGDDFLSPTLVEAECLRRLMPPEDFARWLTGFLPGLASGEPATLFTPAVVTDRSDGKIAHLDGLNFSRAWCWRRLATALPSDHPAVPLMREAAARHLGASLPHVEGDYMGEHWLATFALLALTSG